MAATFEADGHVIRDAQEFWHETRTAIVLSILKVGLVIPNASASYTTGRMFGNGVYFGFGDQSSKSLNYSQGLWDTAGQPYDSRCSVFGADVTMGRAFVSEHAWRKRVPESFDNVFAEGGVGGETNNEMIVYLMPQCTLEYVVEFDTRSSQVVWKPVVIWVVIPKSTGKTTP